MLDLFSKLAAAEFEARAILPVRELGAYEALWARKSTTFKWLADTFSKHPHSLPSDCVSRADACEHARMALDLIRAAGIEHFGVRVHGAGDYPARLRDARHPIELLYFQGNWDLTASRCVAIAGTRHPSHAGVRRAAQLTRQVVEAGFTVVSGLAQGIDTVAHETAIDAGGHTIAVLGTPITGCYPSANRRLQQRIADQFLLISQVPILRHSRQSPQSNRLFFRERNATLSALSEATVIVEAGDTSGSLILGRHALLQKRRLFILDRCFENPDLTWPAKFVELGAIRLAHVDQIAAHLAA
jgi:DNA processing protein